MFISKASNTIVASEYIKLPYYCLHFSVISICVFLPKLQAEQANRKENTLKHRPVLSTVGKLDLVYLKV